jgi:hypothetical protein
MEGKGKYLWKNGDSYDGDWKKDVRNGKGVFTWKDGDIYDGDWKNGVKEGNCVYFNKKTGKKSNEVWKDNKFVNEN